MKKLLTIIGLAALVAMPAGAEVGTISFGITNTIGKNATTSANLGNAVKVDGQDNCGLVLKMAGSEAGTGAVTVNFARSHNNSDWETSPRFALVTALNGLTPVVFYTNMPPEVIGSAGWIKVVSIVNADANVNGTNASLTLVKKTIKAAP